MIRICHRPRRPALFDVYAAVQFFAAPVLGNLGDRYGRRPILLFSLLVLSIGYVLMSPAPTLTWLFVARLIAGISSSTFALSYAYITDISPPEIRAQRFGLVGAAFGGGFVLGPVLGGFLGEFGAKTPFYAAAALALINVTYGYFVLGESLRDEQRRPFDLRRANPLGAMLQIRRYPVVVGLAIAYFATWWVTWRSPVRGPITPWKNSIGRKGRSVCLWDLPVFL